MASIHFKVCKGSVTLLKLVKFDVILLTQIQRLNNSLSCNPFEGLLPHAVGRDPKRLTSYLSFVWETFALQKEEYGKVLFTQQSFLG